MNSNLVNLIPQFFDSSGNPLSGGTIETYVAGTTTALATYPTNADALAGTNANPTTISIGASGYPVVSSAVVGIFLKPGKQYKFILKDSSGTTVYSVDNISNLTDTIYDGNANEILKLVGVTSAVNEITVTNAATGNNPSIAATGDDTNIDISIKGKGAAKVRLGQVASVGVVLEADQPILDSSSNEYLKFSKAASAVNELTIGNAATANAPTIAATGGDTNIDVKIDGKGTGKVIVGGTSTGNVELGNASTTEITAKADVRLAAGKNLIFEGSSDDAFETTITVTNPTADRTLTLPDQDIDLTPATQAQQENGSATNVFVTPGRQQYHNSAAKAWVSFYQTTIYAAYGVTSVANTATGRFTVNWTTSFSSTNYAAMAFGRQNVGVNAVCNLSINSAPGAGSITIIAQNGAGTDYNPDPTCVVAYGDQ